MKNKDLAIIFDLDGTLWDSTESACDIWNQVFDKHNEISFKMTKEKVEQLMGKTMEDIGKTLFPELSAEARYAIMGEFEEKEIKYFRENGAILYEGLEEILETLSPNYKLYIVSNCQDGYIQAFLHAHKLEKYFVDIEMFGRTGLEKGDNIKLIMDRNNIKSAVYVGDTQGDEEASSFAEIPFIYAKYGFGKAISPDAIINDIGDLPECIQMFI